MEICREGDEKAIYDEGISGEATSVPGLQVPHELADHPAVGVNTERLAAA